MAIIFISYRRSDSQDVTGRIYDRLVGKFTPKQVFKDVDNIPLGVSFAMHIQQMIGKANVTLVIIGPNWLTATDEQGRRRPDDPGDFVRIEVESALRAGMPVVPVLVANAAMPKASELPKSIQALVARNGMPVRPDPDFNNDIARLFSGIDHLERLLSLKAEKKSKKKKKKKKDAGPIAVVPVPTVVPGEGKIVAFPVVTLAPPAPTVPAKQRGGKRLPPYLVLVLAGLFAVCAVVGFLIGIPLVLRSGGPKGEAKKKDGIVAVIVPQDRAAPEVTDKLPKDKDDDKDKGDDKKDGPKVTDKRPETKKGPKVTDKLPEDEKFEPVDPKIALAKMKFAWVPPGKSWLGGGGGKPGTTPFTLEKGLWCGIYPVTQAEWQEVMGKNPSSFKGNPRFPVECVSWNDVQKFLEKLNSRGGDFSYRLPTEQEWEYICRGGPISQDQSKYHYYFAKSKSDLTPNPTDNLSDKANYYQMGLYKPSDVGGAYLPNPLGIYDMHGNVSQLTNSSEGSARVIRGGSWYKSAEDCTASYRIYFLNTPFGTLDPDTPSYTRGFRLLKVPRVKDKAAPEVPGKLPDDKPKIAPAKEITNKIGMKFAWVPPGKSWLGGGGGKPGTTPFTLEKGLWCGIYPVTQAEWQEVMGKNPSSFKGNPRFPVECVSWNDVQKFLEKLNSRGGDYSYRLPTEQEWEYICRGGPISQDQSKYHYYFAKSKSDLTPSPTDDLSNKANFGNHLQKPSDVGAYLPNPLGIYDMHGNVWEWTILAIPWCDTRWSCGKSRKRRKIGFS